MSEFSGVAAAGSRFVSGDPTRDEDAVPAIDVEVRACSGMGKPSACIPGGKNDGGGGGFPGRLFRGRRSTGGRGGR
jgi:hypothetical protein